MSDSNSHDMKRGAAVFEKLKVSPLLGEFHKAFKLATGLPLRIVGPDTQEWALQGNDENRSPFCVTLNTCASACDACREVNQKLMARAQKVAGASSCKCFTGMSSTAVPVKLGPQVIAYLRTGQIFTSTPSEEMFQKAISVVDQNELTSEIKERLHKSYFSTRELTPDRFQSMVDLLVIFAGQLSQLAGEIAIAADEVESPGIRRAKKIIHENLDEKLSAGDIATEVGMSPSHFSRSFKQEIGVTVTEYITRCRINWACRELGRPNARISDVAFMVGFQSLSQFNRAFLKIVGLNPTEFRREKLASLVA